MNTPIAVIIAIAVCWVLLDISLSRINTNLRRIADHLDNVQTIGLLRPFVKDEAEADE